MDEDGESYEDEHDFEVAIVNNDPMLMSTGEETFIVPSAEGGIVGGIALAGRRVHSVTDFSNSTHSSGFGALPLLPLF